MNLVSRLEKLEAEQRREARPLRHIVLYSVKYGDDMKAKREEAEAEFRRKNPDWH